MVARKNFPANDLKELVAWMKAHPGEAKFSNVTAASQVSGLLLQQLTGTRFQFIPYRGAGPAMNPDRHSKYRTDRRDRRALHGAAPLRGRWSGWIS